MATLVDSPIQQKRILYIKGAPEIVMSKCNLPADAIARYNEQLLAYQNKAMRTLGIAYREIAEGESSAGNRHRNRQTNRTLATR